MNKPRTLREAYESVSFFKDKPEEPKDERQQSMSHILKMSYDLNHYGDELSKASANVADEETKKMLATIGEKLVAMSSEIEDVYGKYLSV